MHPQFNRGVRCKGSCDLPGNSFLPHLRVVSHRQCRGHPPPAWMSESHHHGRGRLCSGASLFAFAKKRISHKAFFMFLVMLLSHNSFVISLFIFFLSALNHITNCFHEWISPFVSGWVSLYPINLYLMSLDLAFESLPRSFRSLRSQDH